MSWGSKLVIQLTVRVLVVEPLDVKTKSADTFVSPWRNEFSAL